jgi:hypothetical protein
LEITPSDYHYNEEATVAAASEAGLEAVDETLSVDKWLLSISLGEYVENFENNLYTRMDRVSAIWDDELTSILDIEKIGHRKRILLSLAGRVGMPNRFGKVQVLGINCLPNNI